jgi:hypothetical protein
VHPGRKFSAQAGLAQPGSGLHLRNPWAAGTTGVPQVEQFVEYVFPANESAGGLCACAPDLTWLPNGGWVAVQANQWQGCAQCGAGARAQEVERKARPGHQAGLFQQQGFAGLGHPAQLHGQVRGAAHQARVSAVGADENPPGGHPAAHRAGA